MCELRIAVCCAGEVFGGVERFILSMCQSLHEREDIRLIVILFAKGWLYRRLKEENVETYLIESGNGYSIRNIAELVRIIRGRDINIVHAHGYKGTVLSSIAAALCGVPVVKTQHGFVEPSGLISMVKSYLYHAIDVMISAIIVKKIVFVSGEIREGYGKACRESQCVVIHNGIREISVTDNRHRCDQVDNNFNIGIVGRLSAVKGHITLLMALNDVRKVGELMDVRLHIFGDGTLGARLKRYCKENGLMGIVLFHGFKENIYEYLKKLDVIVMPSIHEGLPLTLLEAMYLNIPVIASRVGGIKEIMEDRKDCLLVPPANVQALADALRVMYHDQDLRMVLSRNAFHKVKTRYMFPSTMAQYLGVYRSVVKAEGNGSGQ